MCFRCLAGNKQRWQSQILTTKAWIAGREATDVYSPVFVRIWGSVKVGRRPSEVADVGAAFVDRVGDAFAFDFQLHLSQSGHDGEDHDAHGRCFGVRITATQVE